MQEDAQQKSNGHVQERFRGKDIVSPDEAIFRIICTIEPMDPYDKASAYFILCGHRLRYIGHDVWETVPDDTPPFPPDSPDAFLSSSNGAKRYTRHEIFSHMIDELRAMDLDTLARAYHVIYGDKVASYHGNGNRGYFLIDKNNQPDSN